MTPNGWRNLSALLAIACLVLAWRGCNRPRAAPTEEACTEAALARAAADPDHANNYGARDRAERRRAAASADRDEAAEDDGLTDEDQPAWSVTAPAWVLWLAPQPGEHLLDYRDRIVPLAQAAVAPHRSRVVRGRDDFAQVAGLNTTQVAELDAAVDEAATAIQERVLGAALGGELMPSTFKPTTGVALARDVLDAVDQAQRRFDASLRDDQRDALARHPFDVADYLLFHTRWEDMIGAK